MCKLKKVGTILYAASIAMDLYRNIILWEQAGNTQISLTLLAQHTHVTRCTFAIFVVVLTVIAAS